MCRVKACRGRKRRTSAVSPRNLARAELPRASRLRMAVLPAQSARPVVRPYP